MIAKSLQEIRLTFGNVRQCEPYRPDLYPTSYEFIADGAKVDATFLDGKCLHVMVAYATAPAGTVVEKLALFSGFESWSERPATDSEFPIYFPLFDPSRNRFFVEEHLKAFAMAQQNMGLGELVLWISSHEYPEMLQAYRSKRRGD